MRDGVFLASLEPGLEVVGDGVVVVVLVGSSTVKFSKTDGTSSLSSPADSI